MFEMKESGRGTPIGYASFIQWVLNKVNIPSQRLLKKSISIDQELTKKKLNMMGFSYNQATGTYRAILRGNDPDLNREDEDEMNIDEGEDNEGEDEDEDVGAENAGSNIANLMEAMRLQQIENQNLMNDYFTTLTTRVTEQAAQFTAYSTLQEQRYN